MIRMELNKLVISELREEQIIILKEVDGDRAFPIAIGIFEAAAIDRGLKAIKTPRPMTHDLMANIIRGLNIELEKVVVCDLRDNTFYATLNFRRDGKKIEIDARPSDAIALAIQLGTPIYVEERVLERLAGNDFE